MAATNKSIRVGGTAAAASYDVLIATDPEVPTADFEEALADYQSLRSDFSGAVKKQASKQASCLRRDAPRSCVRTFDASDDLLLGIAAEIDLNDQLLTALLDEQQAQADLLDSQSAAQSEQNVKADRRFKREVKACARAL